MDIAHFKYTLKHKKAFLKTEKQILGKNTLSGYFHDIDKLILYLIPFLKSKKVSEIHRKFSKHHLPNAIEKEKYMIQSIIDWECARFTKPDKPLNARETLNNFYPEYKSYYIFIFKYKNKRILDLIT